MNDLWQALEERTHTWDALARQGVADAIWRDYVSLRFGHTANPRAQEYLYPYLNHRDRRVRLEAVDAAAWVFRGTGSRVVEDLGYFTKHPDPFLRDRAVTIVGSAVYGARDVTVLEILKPYLRHPNRFIRALALVQIGKATTGQASESVLGEIERVAASVNSRQDEVALTIARAFAGRPTEAAYGLVRGDQSAEDGFRNQFAMSVLVRGASDDWFERACEEVFRPHLGADGAAEGLHAREAIVGVCNAGEGRGMVALGRVLHARGERCLTALAAGCFAGADIASNMGPLVELARATDTQSQRIAAVGLGRLTAAMGDGEVVDILAGLCQARDSAVQAAALRGLAIAAASSSDETLRALCVERTQRPETACAAIRALGLLYSGSGRADVFDQIAGLARTYRRRPVVGRKHSRPLAACYLAVGDIYRGTGSDEPMPFLVDVLELPRVGRNAEYQWCAAKALVATEFRAAEFVKSTIAPGQADSATYAGYVWMERAMTHWA